MDDELIKLQEYSAQVEELRMEQRKNKVSMAPDSVQSMDVSKYFESDLKSAETLVDEEIKKQAQYMNSLGMDVTPNLEQIETKKIK